MSNSAWRYPFHWPLQGEMLTLLPEYCKVLVDMVTGDDVRIIMPGGTQFIVPAWSLYRNSHVKMSSAVIGGRARWSKNLGLTYVAYCAKTHKPHFCARSEQERRDWTQAVERRRMLASVSNAIQVAQHNGKMSS